MNEYPYLGKIVDLGRNLVVLFTSPKHGRVVVSDGGWKLGEVSEEWREESFINISSQN